MCLCHAPPLHTHSRRQMLCGTAATAVAAPLLAGCDRDDWTFNLVPESQVQALAARSWAQMRQTVPPSQDEKRQDIVRRIADRLLGANGQNPAGWQVELFASQQVNAFALPGGRIGVFEGMFRVAANPAQMAAVIGHEIGHVLARHSEARMNAQAWQHLGLQVVRIALGLGDVPYSSQIAAVLGLGTEYGLLLPYSRRQEIQADRLGVLAMATAGYDPSQAPELWRRMDQMLPQRGPTFLATHPAPATRIEELEALVPEARKRMPKTAG
jgi:predicted Zn-dependent protease